MSGIEGGDMNIEFICWMILYPPSAELTNWIAAKTDGLYFRKGPSKGASALGSFTHVLIWLGVGYRLFEK